MEFNEDLAVIHAYLCADGYVIKNPPTQKHKYYQVGLRNTNLLLLKDFQKRFEKLWGMKPILVEGQRCNKGSKYVYGFLTRNFGSFYSWEWRMPSLNKKLSRVWLRTYFDCEGWVSIERHKSRLIGVDCVNLFGLKQVKEALARNGIDSKLKKKKGKNIFRLYIYGKENLIKFKKNIDFYHPQKSIKLEKAINDYMIYDWKFPKDMGKLRNFIKTLMHKKARIRTDNGVIRITSNKKENLVILKKNLEAIFTIESRVNEMINGIGTHYYQLNIYKRQEVKRTIESNLLNNIEEAKWLKLGK